MTEHRPGSRGMRSIWSAGISPGNPDEVSGENAHGCTWVIALNKHTSEKQNCILKDEIHKSQSQP